MDTVSDATPEGLVSPPEIETQWKFLAQLHLLLSLWRRAEEVGWSYSNNFITWPMQMSSSQNWTRDISLVEKCVNHYTTDALNVMVTLFFHLWEVYGVYCTAFPETRALQHHIHTCHLFFKNEPRETLEIFPFLYFIKKIPTQPKRKKKKICAFNKEKEIYIHSELNENIMLCVQSCCMCLNPTIKTKHHSKRKRKISYLIHSCIEKAKEWGIISFFSAAV